MILLRNIFFIGCLTVMISCASSQKGTIYKEENKYLKGVQQLTFGGDNAEAYWSFDNNYLVFQSNNPDWGLKCDQIFYMKATTPEKTSEGLMVTPDRISNGQGRTTCAYWMPDGKYILYASTFGGGRKCPEEPERVHGQYTWSLYPSYDIYVADLKGKDTKKLIDSPGYDAEATVSPKGDRIVFTSMRTGDPELFVCNLDGSNVVQITDELGYDGGAFFSPDGKQIVFRASRPKTEEEITKYQELLVRDLVEPSDMELFMVNADGTNLRQITKLGGANWAPFMTPDGKKILFSTNHHSKKGFPFNIFSINIDGTDLKQITYDNTFDSFPMFSPDGKKLVFCSNRNNKGTRNTNIFVAKWKG